MMSPARRPAMRVIERESGDRERLKALARREEDAEQKDRFLCAVHAMDGVKTGTIVGRWPRPAPLSVPPTAALRGRCVSLAVVGHRPLRETVGGPLIQPSPPLPHTPSAPPAPSRSHPRSDTSPAAGSKTSATPAPCCSASGRSSSPPSPPVHPLDTAC